ncbi:MAG: 4Fe-4S binding protein [Methanocellales archaeon]|nr:4Fe-4S binding protein [Methanocellales archaeon]
MIVDKHKCGYCGACVAVCPMDAVELIEAWIEISEECNDCGVCAKICPVGALRRGFTPRKSKISCAQKPKGFCPAPF